MTRRLRFVVLAVLAGAALASVAAVSAATVRPLLASSPFTPLSGPSVPCLNGGLPCYLPSEIQQAYNFPSGPAAPNGAGQTIVVVTAYGAPFVGPDIQTFGGLTGVPYPPNLTVVPQKTAIPAAHGSGQTYFWEVETDLDVQWAYAMAPRAKIVLAVANSDDTLDIAQVMREVLRSTPARSSRRASAWTRPGPASDPSLVSTFSPMYLDVLRHGGTVLAALGRPRRLERHRARGDVLPRARGDAVGDGGLPGLGSARPRGRRHGGQSVSRRPAERRRHLRRRAGVERDLTVRGVRVRVAALRVWSSTLRRGSARCTRRTVSSPTSRTTPRSSAARS